MVMVCKGFEEGTLLPYMRGLITYAFLHRMGICKQWTRQLDWITGPGLNYWTALSMLTSGVDLQLEWAWVYIMLM